MNLHLFIYKALLIVFAFFMLIAAGTLYFLLQSPAIPRNAVWVFQLEDFILGMYVAAIIATLLLRHFESPAAKLATLALNIILLLAFPFGTALGIYGLWKVDRQPKPPPQ